MALTRPKFCCFNRSQIGLVPILLYDFESRSGLGLRESEHPLHPYLRMIRDKDLMLRGVSKADIVELRESCWA